MNLLHFGVIFTYTYTFHNQLFYLLGDVSVISSACPQALRFVACQLLLEITSYLRETFVVSVQIKITSMPDSGNTVSPCTRSHTEVSHTSSGGRKPKHSIATSIAKKISAVQRRKSSVGLLLSLQGENLKDDASQSPSTSRVKRNSTSVALSKKSPKISRKFSRKLSRPSMDRQASMTMFAEDPEELPDEMLDFPWINILIQMNKSINFLCAHGSDKCPDACPVEQAKSCNMLVDVLKKLYDRHTYQVNDLSSENAEQLKSTNMDPVYKYLITQVII